MVDRATPATGESRAAAPGSEYPVLAGSPESYYHEMFDVDAIRDQLLVPLGPGGNRCFRTQIMDFSGRNPVDSAIHVSPRDAILLADGGFLQKPALAHHWDLRVYLHVEVADVLHRGTIRDQAWMDSAQAAAERYRSYYLPGEELYLAEVHPAEQADIVIDNRNFDGPRILQLPIGAPLTGTPLSRGSRGDADDDAS